LRGWVDHDREFLRTRERIAAQARLWEDEGKPSDRLLPPGRPLAEGEDLLATRRDDLVADMITYVEASTTAAKAEEDAKRAVQHRRLRTSRLVAAVMGLLALGAIGGGTIAWWQRGEADRNAEQARAAQAQAEKNFIYAMHYPIQASLRRPWRLSSNISMAIRFQKQTSPTRYLPDTEDKTNPS
jgi:class 3 adenylate cyclase